MDDVAGGLSRAFVLKRWEDEESPKDESSASWGAWCDPYTSTRGQVGDTGSVSLGSVPAEGSNAALRGRGRGRGQNGARPSSRHVKVRLAQKNPDSGREVQGLYGRLPPSGSRHFPSSADFAQLSRWMFLTGA